MHLKEGTTLAIEQIPSCLTPWAKTATSTPCVAAVSSLPQPRRASPPARAAARTRGARAGAPRRRGAARRAARARRPRGARCRRPPPRGPSRPRDRIKHYGSESGTVIRNDRPSVSLWCHYWTGLPNTPDARKPFDPSREPKHTIPRRLRTSPALPAPLSAARSPGPCALLQSTRYL